MTCPRGTPGGGGETRGCRHVDVRMMLDVLLEVKDQEEARGHASVMEGGRGSVMEHTSSVDVVRGTIGTHSFKWLNIHSSKRTHPPMPT